MARWVMIIDLRKCVGCETCVEVCRQVNRTPPGPAWRKLIEHEIKDNPGGKHLFLTISCMHCEKPSCLEVCPSGATYRRPDGIVDIDLDRCLGCGACVVACPYQARSIARSDIMAEEITTKTKDRIGVCTKCNFCLQHIDSGLAQGLKPGTDPEATPKCVRFCLADALYFGDLDDPGSEVSRLIHDNKVVRLQEEQGTDPSVYYIVP
jgi:phenylacetyl-CoA:acceptor oxidoreductase subunit 1